MRLLATGTLHTDPQRKTSKNGNAYTSATLKDSTTTPAAWISVIAFNELADELLHYRATDSVSVAGKATVDVYVAEGRQPRPTINLTVDQIAGLKPPDKSRIEAVQTPAAAEPQKGKPGRVSTTKDHQQKGYAEATSKSLSDARERREEERKAAPAPTGICSICEHEFDATGRCGCPF